MVALRDLHACLLIWGDRGHHELLKVLEYKPLIKVIEQKESISIDALEYQVWRRQPTKLENFQHLVIVIFTWENWCFYKKFHGRASKWPHVNRLSICWRLVLLVATHENLRSPIVSTLYIRVDLMPVEGCWTKVNELDRFLIFHHHNVLRLQVTMNQVCIFKSD